MHDAKSAAISSTFSSSKLATRAAHALDAHAPVPGVRESSGRRVEIEDGHCTSACVQRQWRWRRRRRRRLMGRKWRNLSFGTREAELGKVRPAGKMAFRVRRSGFWTLRATGRPHGWPWSWGRAGEGEGALCTSRRAVWPTGSRSSPSITLRLAEEISAAGSCDEALPPACFGSCAHKISIHELRIRNELRTARAI